ncbi:conserved hypothetical protein [Fibrobacter succinogenes subsp. succinogenes S85]|uniref:DUF4422 domain-containing protein n=2 Tax=Fibrobacter succinogenes TaxID=833 RepID=A0ABM5LGR4_FIBSS|nr:conserved hypothetical protein [Fibrobacter succinogenes subsp. succinogenes S85]
MPDREICMNAKVIVATHKTYRMPTDPMYVPVHVGAEGKPSLGYIGDNTGDNISLKNKNYCELSGLYWAWKNLDADYLGIAHYRRHFSIRPKKDKWNSILSEKELMPLFSDCDVVLPKPRDYFIETNYSQYAYAHHAIDLDTTREILTEKYPEYIPVYDDYMKRTIGHRFNMFIMKRDVLNRYCEWLFDILFELEKRLDISQYSLNDSRVFGFVSERLLDVWLEKNAIQYKEIPCMFMEKQNWIVKGFKFLVRKLTRK